MALGDKRGWYGTELAVRSGYSQADVSALRTGRRQAKLAMACDMAEALGYELVLQEKRK